MLHHAPTSPSSTPPREPGVAFPGASARAEADADGHVVEAARRGDRGAWASLYRRYARMVHAVLLARIPAPDADDLVHDVFASAMRSAATLRRDDHFGAWIAAVARNRSTDFLRRRRRGREALREFGAHPPREHAAPRELHELTADEALDAISRLPDAYKETLIMRLVEGLTGPQIAERTGMTHGSVRVNLCRGMELLRDALGLEQRP